jgi:CMP-N-acetylneuraminic acid synthetase
MDVLAIVPARGGSKSIPRKNLVPLAGRPLIAYTIEAAQHSKLISRCVLSTDDEEIAATGRSLGIEVPFMRPAHLAMDETPMIQVLQHALSWFKSCAPAPDVVIVLQPTSPLRRASHIDSAIELIRTSGAETVVSVVEVPHQFLPGSLMQLAENRLIPYVTGPLVLRRQDKPRLYARNGPAVLAVRREAVEKGALYTDHVVPLEMSRRESVDIDDWEDLALAEFWIQGASGSEYR